MSDQESTAGKPKRYALFAGEYYYPAGGWEDFIGSADNPETLRADVARSLDHEWYQIVDLRTGTVLEESTPEELRREHPELTRGEPLPEDRGISRP